MKSLWDLQPNEEGTILDIDLSSSEAERLKSYGFNQGQNAKYLYKTSMGGPRVYLLEDTVYSLSYEMASQVQIKKELS